MFQHGTFVDVKLGEEDVRHMRTRLTLAHPSRGTSNRRFGLNRAEIKLHFLLSLPPSNSLTSTATAASFAGWSERRRLRPSRLAAPLQPLRGRQLAREQQQRISSRTNSPPSPSIHLRNRPASQRSCNRVPQRIAPPLRQFPRKQQQPPRPNEQRRSPQSERRTRGTP